MNGIPNKILKDNSTYLSPFFEELFNLSIETNTFPDDFKIGKVAPVFKSGDKEDLNNYRPISVLPTIARIFERLLYNQLYDYLTVNKLLGDEQYGFRSLHSTAMALGKMSNQWLMNMDNGNLSAVVFLDIRKAFDTVDHTILLQKLNCYGIQGDSVKLLESYLTNRMQCCSVNGHISPLEIIKCGVPQGSILGPLLFIVHMNDLPKSVSNVDITMFADDTNFMRSISSLNEIKDELIPALRKVYNWLRCNKLSLNTVKTEFMIIGTANGLERLDKCPVSTPYLISSGPDCHIRRVRCVKYLGIIVDDTLTWEEHTEYISVKIKRGIGILKVTGKFLKRESLILIYRTLIEQYLRYCSTVWGQCNETQKDKLQALQNKAARTIAKVKFHDADHTRLLQDLGWLNVRSLLELDMGIFMYKCQNKLMPDSITNLFRTVDSVHSYQTRAAKSGNLYIPKSLHSSAQKSISNNGAKAWNEIP